MAKQETVTPLQQLKMDLKEKNPGSFYVFYGEETFLMQHYLTQLKKLLLDEVTEAFNFHRLTAESFDIRTLADAVENLPMMAEHSMVHLDDVDPYKLPESDRSKLAEILQDIPSYCTVIFTFVTASWKPDNRQKKLTDSFGKAQIVEFAKQDQRDLVPWIGRHFMAKGKRISNDLCIYLMEITGGTMIALSGEISKICAYSGAEQIVKSDIDAVVEPVMDAVVFQMTDLIGAGKYGDALKKLQQLLKMQQEPVAILGAIGGHFRKLSAARVLADNGKQASDLMKLFRMSDYAARKTMDMARRFSAQFYTRANELILETDYKLKTSFDDADRLLEMLIMELAMESRA